MHERPASARYAGQNRDPLLLEIWQKALSGPYSITVKGRSQFQRLRQQLYRLRLILQADNDPLYPSLQPLSITSQPLGEGRFKITIGPADSDLRQQLFEAGIGASTPISGLTQEEDDWLDPTKPATGPIPDRFKPKKG